MGSEKRVDGFRKFTNLGSDLIEFEEVVKKERSNFHWNENNVIYLCNVHPEGTKFVETLISGWRIIYRL